MLFGKKSMKFVAKFKQFTLFAAHMKNPSLYQIGFSDASCYIPNAYHQLHSPITTFVPQ